MATLRRQIELASDLLAFIQSFQSPNRKHLVNPVCTVGALIAIAGLWVLVMLHFLVFGIFQMSRAMRVTCILQSSFARGFSLSNATQLLGSRNETRTWISLVLVHSTHSHCTAVPLTLDCMMHNLKSTLRGPYSSLFSS